MTDVAYGFAIIAGFAIMAAAVFFDSTPAAILGFAVCLLTGMDIHGAQVVKGIRELKEDEL